MARSLVEVGAAAAGWGAPGSDHSHWTERAQALLAPLLHAAAIDGAEMRTVLTWVDRHQALPAQQVLCGQPGQTTELARNLLDGIVATDERELSGIWSTASGALSGFRTDEALAATSRPDFDPGLFVGTSDTIYIAAPAHSQALVAPMVVGLIDDIRRATYRRRAEGAGLGWSDPPVLLALDEVANIAPLPDLPALVSEGAGQGLLTLACLQDLSQGRARWGHQADAFVSLFGTTVVLPGIADVPTLRAISTLAGEVEVPVRGVSAAKSAGGRLQRSISVQTTWRPRLPPDLIGRGVPGAALAVDDRNQMGWVTLTPAHRSTPFREVLDLAHRRPPPPGRADLVRADRGDGSAGRTR
jgi:type IV secretory pathway TraG/TraD family ATPase VirD4